MTAPSRAASAARLESSVRRRAQSDSGSEAASTRLKCAVSFAVSTGDAANIAPASHDSRFPRPIRRATTNVATLYLLRAERLRAEVGVSRALGASQFALTQRFVDEGLVVAFAGGMVAPPIVVLAVSSKLGFTPGQVPRLHDVVLTPSLMLFVVALSLLIGVLPRPLLDQIEPPARLVVELVGR